jgi:hypothetical protein
MPKRFLALRRLALVGTVALAVVALVLVLSACSAPPVHPKALHHAHHGPSAATVYAQDACESLSEATAAVTAGAPGSGTLASTDWFDASGGFGITAQHAPSISAESAMLNLATDNSNLELDVTAGDGRSEADFASDLAQGPDQLPARPIHCAPSRARVGRCAGGGGGRSLRIVPGPSRPRR